MDIEKLLKVAKDIIAEQARHDITTILTNIIAAMNLSTPEGYIEAQRLKSTLDAAFDASVVNGYSPSLRYILEALSAEKYTGNGAKEYFNGIFSGNVLESFTALSQYLADYNAMVNKVQVTITALEALGVRAYKVTEFEVGFIVPEDLSDLQTVAKKLQMWNKFLALSSEIAGDADPSTNLNRVSNGSLEFFIAKSLGVAKIVEIVIQHILTLYQEVQKIQKTREEINGLKIDNENKRKMLVALDSGLEKSADEFTKLTVETVFKDKSVAKDRKEELKTQFGVMVRIVLNDVQEGVQIEVTPPEQPAEVPVDSDDESTEAVQSIKLSNIDLLELYSRPIAQRKLPFEIQIPDVVETNETSSAKTPET